MKRNTVKINVLQYTCKGGDRNKAKTLKPEHTIHGTVQATCREGIGACFSIGDLYRGLFSSGVQNPLLTKVQSIYKGV